MQTKNVGGSDAPRRSNLGVLPDWVASWGTTGPLCLIFGTGAIVSGIDDGNDGRLSTKAFGYGEHGKIESLTFRLQDPSVLDGFVIALPSVLMGLFMCGFALDLIRSTRPGTEGRQFSRITPKRAVIASMLGGLALVVSLCVQAVPLWYFAQEDIKVFQHADGVFSTLLLVIAIHSLSTYLTARGNRAEDELEGLV